MKKIFSILIIFLLTFSFVGCSAATPTQPQLVEKMPWGSVWSNAYEELVYDIVKTNSLKENTIVANGKVSQIYSPLTTGISKLTTTYTMTYVDNTEIAEESAGKTDVMTSSVTVNYSTGLPIKVEKQFNIAPRKNSDGNFITNNSYKYTADYATHKATISIGVEDKTDLKTFDTSLEYKTKDFEFSIPDSVSYDNEYLLFAIRAFKVDTQLGSSSSFYLNNVFDIYDGYSTHAMTISYKTEAVSYDLTTKDSEGNKVSLISNYSELDESKNYVDVKPDENGDYKIDCAVGTISKSTRPAGPSMTVYVTDQDKLFKLSDKETTAGTRSIVVKMEESQYSIAGLTENYKMTYTLSEYHNTPTETSII